MTNQKFAESYAKKEHLRRGFFDKKEFKKDFRNLLSIKRMTSRFILNLPINEKLLVNNIVIATNTFGVSKSNILFRSILNEEQWSVVKTILIFLSSMSIKDDKTEPNYIMQNILMEDLGLILFRKANL